MSKEARYSVVGYFGFVVEFHSK